MCDKKEKPEKPASLLPESKEPNRSAHNLSWMDKVLSEKRLRDLWSPYSR